MSFSKTAFISIYPSRKLLTADGNLKGIGDGNNNKWV